MQLYIRRDTGENEEKVCAPTTLPNASFFPLTDAELPASLIANGRTRLSTLIWLSPKLAPRALCTGLGQCGRCRIRFLSNPPMATEREEAFFSPEECRQGWRLACQHTLQSLADKTTWYLALPKDAFLPETRIENRPRSSSFGPLGLALDLGTTTVCWALQDLSAPENKPLWETSYPNPQGAFGSDIISRLQAAQDPALRALMGRRVRESLARSLVSAGFSLSALSAVCLAANTAMTDIFLDKDISGLARSPYHLSHAGDETFAHTGLPSLYLPPLLGPFAGSDVSAGIYYCLHTFRAPWLLVDLGTNAEFALFDANGRLFVTSVPMGPAMEGIGMRSGRVAGRGVISAVSLTPSGFVASDPYGTILQATGISATGYFSLLAELCRNGLVSRDGQFVVKPQIPLFGKIMAGLQDLGGRKALQLPQGVYITLDDIEALLKVRAAFVVATSRLLARAGLCANDLTQIVFAGALGSHCDSQALTELGFIPRDLRTKPVAGGNTALLGALLLLSDTRDKKAFVDLCRKAILLQLPDDPAFERDFIAAMCFA